MTWDRDKELLSPLHKAVMANLEACFNGDKNAYEAIVQGFHDSICDDSPLSEVDMEWAKSVAEAWVKG